jgi:hypothetical protein
VSHHILRRNGVAIAKHPLQFPARERTRHDGAESAKRQCVLDSILQNTSQFAFGLDTVRVLPITKRSPGLNVAELLAFDVVSVLCNPTNLQGRPAHTKDESGTILDPTVALFDFDVLPRRSEPLEGTNTSMPLEHVSGRGFNAGTPFERGHALLTQRSRDTDNGTSRAWLLVTSPW